MKPLTPKKTINRAMQTYLQKGYSKEWINQRLKTIEVRKELTDEWNRVGIKKQSDYANQNLNMYLVCKSMY